MTVSHSGSSTEAAGTSPPPQVVADQRSASTYTAPHARGPGVLFAAEAHDPRWKANVGGEGLEPVEGGWGNAFQIPSSASGELVLKFPRPFSQVLWLLIILLAWIVIAGAAFSRRRVGALSGAAR